MSLTKLQLVGIVGGVLGVILVVVFFVWRPYVMQTPQTSEVSPAENEGRENGVSNEQIIGKSVEGRNIVAYTFGGGDTHLLFVGGIHGGYEWNSIMLAYEFIDYFTINPQLIPQGVRISIIPNANPDGSFAYVGVEDRFSFTDIPVGDNSAGTGRFNARGVDLNRNFDCKWQPESTWRNNFVSAGTEPFSEPEAAALRDYVLATAPTAAVFWHSIANTVYGSECEAGVLPVTVDIMNEYAQAASYGAVARFDSYPITGDAEGWLASLGIPAITVELESRNSLEWTRNLAGVNAVLTYFTQE